MNLSRRLIAAALILCPCWLGHGAATADQATGTDARIDFAHDIVPILQTHCYECHGGENSEGGFSINTRALILDADVVEPGDPSRSKLIALIRSEDPETRMPPKDRPLLPETARELLARWVAAGLPWDEGYTFAPRSYAPPLRPRRPELPPATEGHGNPIDRIIDAYLAEHELTRPLPLSDAHFMRRIHFDLVGLPPTAAALNAFLKNENADKRAQLIAELLDENESYATHWLSFWNDLLRNAYAGTGFIDGGRSQITEWLFRSLYENKPYDQFVRELIAPQPAAAGFIAGIQWRGNVNASQRREIQFAQSISQVFLGINMKCASCHDSFIDRWTLEETYNLSAIYATEPLELHRCDKPVGQVARAAWIFPELGEIDPDAPRDARLRQLAALMTHPQNGRLTRTIVNRLWHRMMGRGIVHPVDAMHTRPWSDDLLDYLAVHLADSSFDLKQTLALIATSEAYQSQAVVQLEEPVADEFVYQGPITKRLTAEQFMDALWQITGTWPEPNRAAFLGSGRAQGGQLAAVLRVLATDMPTMPENIEAWQAAWGDHRLRAALLPVDPLQASLGRPIREQVVTKRPALLSTLEAITLTNGERVATILRRGADDLVQRFDGSAEALVHWLFLSALTREPTTEERQLALELLGQAPNSRNTEDLLWAVFMLPDFQLLR